MIRCVAAPVPAPLPVPQSTPRPTPTPMRVPPLQSSIISTQAFELPPSAIISGSLVLLAVATSFGAACVLWRAHRCAGARCSGLCCASPSLPPRCHRSPYTPPPPSPRALYDLCWSKMSVKGPKFSSRGSAPHPARATALDPYRS